MMGKKANSVLNSVLSTRQHSAFCENGKQRSELGDGRNEGWEQALPGFVGRCWPAEPVLASAAGASRGSRGDSGASSGPAPAGKLVLCFPVLPLVLLPQDVLL